MRVLLDENMPHKLRACLKDHQAATAVFMGFGGYKNGALLTAAEEAGFEVLVTADLSLEYQQNMAGRQIAIVSLSANSWRILQHHIPQIASAIAASVPGSFVRVNCGAS